MDKIIKIACYSFVSLGCVAMTGCSNSNDDVDNDSSAKTKHLVIEAGVPQTKVNWSNARDLTWQTGDQIEIYDSGDQRGLFQSVDNNSGTANFEFVDGTNSFSYGYLVAHYPPQNLGTGYSYILKAEGQKQVGNDNVNHLKNHTYLRGELRFRPQHGNSVHIDLSHEMAQIAFQVTVPDGLDASSIAKIAIEANSNVFYSQYDDEDFSGINTSTVSIETDFTSESIAAGETLKVYMMIIPVNITNADFRIALYNSSNSMIAHQDINGVSVNYVSSTQYQAPVSNLTVD